MNKAEIVQIIKKGGVVLIGNKIYDKNNVDQLPSEAQIEAATMKGKVDTYHNISLAPVINIHKDEVSKENVLETPPIQLNNKYLIFAALAVIVILITVIPRQTIQVVTPSYESATRGKKILKFSQLMTYNQRKVLVPLPNITTEYDFRINFPTEQGKAKIDGKVAKSTKKADLLELNFDKIYTNQKEFIIEVYVEYYE